MTRHDDPFGRRLRVGSIFSGIGGIEHGLEQTGAYRTVWQIENNDYAQQILKQHWPQATLHSDVREVRADQLKPVDMLCGGFPCQDLSFAGSGEGLDGARSGLWWEFHRIIRDLRPGLVLVENVPALLHRGMGRVLGSLAEIGYDAEWDCVPAAAVGAPHRRDRVFIVAYPSSGRGQDHRLRPRRPIFGSRSPPPFVADAEGARLGGSWVWGRSAHPGEDVADAGRGRRESESGRGLHAWEPDPAGGGQPAGAGDQPAPHGWAVEPDVGRVADGVPDRVDRLRVLGNAVVPQVAEYIGNRIIHAIQPGD